MEVTHLAPDIELPAGWHQPRVSAIAARRANSTVGGPFGSDLVAKDYVDSGVPVIRGQNMGQRYVAGEFAFVSPAKAKALQANLARPSDLVFTQRGTLGQVALVPTGPYEEYLISQSQMKLTLDCGAAAPGYVHQYFASALGQKQILDSAIQTGVPHTNLGILRNYAVPMPRRVDEQEAIAAALTDADTLIDSLEQLLTKKRQIKRGAMQELLTGKRRLPGYTSTWITRRIGSFAPLQRGFDLPSRARRSGEYPVVYSNGILYFHCEFMVKGPGVVTGRSGTIGAVSFVEKNYWPHNTSLWVTSFNGSDPRFIFYLFQQIGLERFATGSGVPTLNRNDVHAFEVHVPASVGEQAEIAQALSDIDTELTALESRLTKARSLKQAMGQALLTGRIRLVEPTP